MGSNLEELVYVERLARGESVYALPLLDFEGGE